MKKNEKRTYLSPETEVVRFNGNDIITTSPYVPEIPGDGDGEYEVEVLQPEVSNP